MATHDKNRGNKNVGPAKRIHYNNKASYTRFEELIKAQGVDFEDIGSVVEQAFGHTDFSQTQDAIIALINDGKVTVKIIDIHQPSRTVEYIEYMKRRLSYTNDRIDLIPPLPHSRLTAFRPSYLAPIEKQVDSKADQLPAENPYPKSLFNSYQEFEAAANAVRERVASGGVPKIDRED